MTHTEPAARRVYAQSIRHAIANMTPYQRDTVAADGATGRVNLSYERSTTLGALLLAGIVDEAGLYTELGLAVADSLARDRHLARDFPAFTGAGVTEAHARYCRENGHATHVEDGEVHPRCPRCGVERAEPLPQPPSRAAGIVDRLLANAQNSTVGLPVPLYVERWLRMGIENAVTGLPTGGGYDRNIVADKIGDYAEALRLLTARIVDGTLDVRLYAETDEDD